MIFAGEMKVVRKCFVGTLPAALDAVMRTFEERSDALSEYDVAASIDGILAQIEESGDDVPIGIHAESMAFNFGPMRVTPKGDEVFGCPNVTDVSLDILNYWRARSQEAKHPSLRARYADLVWNFAPKLTGKPAGIECARAAIDAYVQIVVDRDCPHPTDGCNSLARALSIALATNDPARVGSIVSAILDYEDAVAELDKLGTWGFSYDLLMENKRVSLTEVQRDTIVDRLERRLSEAAHIPEGSNSSRHHPAAQLAALPLARHYRRAQQRKDVRRVLTTYTRAVASWAGEASSIIVVMWLREAHDILSQFQLKDDADAIAVLMHKLGEGTHEHMAHISLKVGFTTEEIDGFLAEMLQGNDDEIVARIVDYFTPDPQVAEQQVRDLAREAPLSSMFTHSQLDSDGREVARVGSAGDDMEGRVVLMMNQDMQAAETSLDLVIQEWTKRSNVTVDRLLDRLMASPLFSEDRRETLSRGLAAYFDGDHLTAVHLLVPQVEHAFRTLLILTRRSTYKPGRHGGLNLKILDDLLRDSVVDRMFGAKAVKYFKVLLTDQRGWNLRNIVCHGLSSLPSNQPTLSHRVIHVLLCQSMFREKANRADSDSSPTT